MEGTAMGLLLKACTPENTLTVRKILISSFRQGF
jgi:hypothetical protein